VDHGRADLSVLLVMVGVLERVGHYRTRQPELRVVGQRQSLFVVVGALDGGDGPEHLFTVDTHVRRGVDEQRWRQEVAAGTALDEPALYQRPRALLLPDLDVVEVVTELARVGYRPDLGVVSKRGAGTQRARPSAAGAEA